MVNTMEQKLWDTLPFPRCCTYLETFKSNLKTYLFNSAYIIIDIVCCLPT